MLLAAIKDRRHDGAEVAQANLMQRLIHGQRQRKQPFKNRRARPDHVLIEVAGCHNRPGDGSVAQSLLDSRLALKVRNLSATGRGHRSKDQPRNARLEGRSNDRLTLTNLRLSALLERRSDRIRDGGARHRSRERPLVAQVSDHQLCPALRERLRSLRVLVTDQCLNGNPPDEQLPCDGATVSTGGTEHEHWSRRHFAAPCSSQRSNSATCPLGHAPSQGMLPSFSRPAIAWP